MSLDTIVSRLGDFGIRTTGPRKWMAKCPSHEDRVASLSIAEGNSGNALVYCQAGCKTVDVMAALSLPMSELIADEERERGRETFGTIVNAYQYRDENGALLFEVVRLVPKSFRQRRPAPEGGWTWGLGEARRVLYRLPELIASPKNFPVFVVEGEKDADGLRALHPNIVATCNLGGAGRGKWKAEYSEFLRGRRVIVLPDNDDPGREHAMYIVEALSGIAADVRIVELPGLPDKGDVSDWIAAGGTSEKLSEIVTNAKRQPTPIAFLTSAERITGERAARIEMGKRALSFGMKFLDDALGGILPNDLLLLGAKSGVGKTALATMIALHNCGQGKRVHYFALEAEELEIERRMKFQVLASEYFNSSIGERKPIRYLDWAMGRADHIVGHLEDWADDVIRKKLATLQTFYRFNSFTGDDFVKRIDAIKDETDLVILDHLHYVDFAEENENAGYKATVKKIRDSALRIGKPVLVVAHVRKSDRRFDHPVPGLEDFHGSSDVPKIATKAIMLAPAYKVDAASSHLLPTFVQVVKCRPDSSLTRHVAQVTFNIRHNSYEPEYSLGTVNSEGGFDVLTGEKHPIWAQTRRHDDRPYYEGRDTQ